MSIEVLLNEKHRLMREVNKIDREIWDLLKKYRTKLDKKTYFVLKARLYEKKGLEEVGKEFNVTRERIRQIEYKGIIEIDNLIKTGKEFNVTRA